VVEVSGCAVFQALREKGLAYEGLPCVELCLGGFQVAAARTGDSLRMEAPLTLPKDGRCQFVFTPQ